MQTLYPFKLKPLFKEKIWGGQKIRQVMGLDFGLLPNCGESWLVSGVEGNPTVIANGYLAGNELNELVEVFMGDLVGDKVYDRFGDVFPILVKIIDSNDWLSIQVHPDDQLARKRGGEFGKTEMWYVLQADENAELICGFKEQTDADKYLNYLTQGRLPELMNYEMVNKGDVFYIPAGRVHALGPGSLIAEIQQTSDITYRIFDWNRADAAGNLRDLHTEDALDAIDFTRLDSYKTVYNKVTNQTAKLIESAFFVTNILHFNQSIQKNYGQLDSFVILLCTEGKMKLVWNGEVQTLVRGEVILLPNLIEQLELHPDGICELLEVFIR